MVAKGDLQGAFEIAAAALRLEWQKVILYWTELWVKFRNGFLNDLHNLALRIEGTFVWKTGKEAKSLIERGMKAEVEGMRVIFKELGIGGPKAAGAAPVAEKATSLIGLGLAPALGQDLGQIIGPALANAINAELAVDPMIRKARADLAAAEARHKELIAKALEPAVEAGGEVGPMPRVVNDHAAAIAARPKLELGTVKGGFAVPSSRLQFGYGDTFQRKQLDALGDIKDGKGKLPEKIGKEIGSALVFG